MVIKRSSDGGGEQSEQGYSQNKDQNDFRLIDDISQETGINVDEIEKIGKELLIPVYNVGGKKSILECDVEKLYPIFSHPELRGKILSKTYSYLHYYHPELIEYLDFHDAIDVLCWLIKLKYSSKEDIKKKQYKIDKLFANFIKENDLHKRNLKKLIGKSFSREKFCFHLNKGWYNELIRAYPLQFDFLNIGTRIDPAICNGKSLSWNITQSYYSIYEYINALVFTNNSTLDTKQHKKSTSFFNNNLFKKFSLSLLMHPFNLSAPPFEDLSIVRGETKDFWKFQYARYPRDLSKSFFDLENSYIKALEKHGNFIDFLYSFRVWANYLGISTIIEIEDGFLLSYLYKNLGILCFFYASFAEILGIVFLGEDRMIELLANISEKYILKQNNFRDNWYIIPIFIRFRIYQKYGILKNKNVDFLTPPNPDPLSL